MGVTGVTPKLEPRVSEVEALVKDEWYTSDMAKHFNVGDGTMKRFLLSMGWPHRKKCMSESQLK